MNAEQKTKQMETQILELKARVLDTIDEKAEIIQVLSFKEEFISRIARTLFPQETESVSFDEIESTIKELIVFKMERQVHDANADTENITDAEFTDLTE